LLSRNNIKKDLYIYTHKKAIVLFQVVKILFIAEFILFSLFSYGFDFVNQDSANKIDSVLNVLNTQTDEAEIIESLEYLSSLYSDQENFILAHKTIDSAILIAKNSGKKYHIALAMGTKGKLFRQEGKFETSLKVLLDAYNLAKEIKEQEIKMVISNNIGVTYRRLAEDNKALKFHLEALKIAEQLNNLQNIAIASNSIGIIYTYQGNHDESLIYYYKALKLEKERKNYLGVAINYNSIAWIYELKEDYSKAIDFYKKSLEANIKNNDEKGIVICYSDLGKVYHKIGEYLLALDYYKKTLAVNEKLGDKRYIARSYIYIGEVHRDLGNYSQSLSNLEKGLNYARQVNSKRMLMMAYEQFSLTYERINNITEAFEHFKMYNIYKDSVFNDEKSNQIIEMQTRFETEKKEKENILLKNENSLNESRIQRQRIIVISTIIILLLITILVFVLLKNRSNQKKAIELLGKQNDEIRRQKEEIQTQAQDLEEAVNTKNRFFSIIAHDLISPFNTLIGYSETLKYNLDKVSEKEMREYVDLIYKRSEETHELLLNLLEWSLSQTQSIRYQPEELSIKKLIKEKISLLKGQANEKSIQLEFHEGDEVKVYADTNMLTTIIRNLVSNAIKFTKEGKVVISYTQQAGFCKVTIEDTGVGISKQKLNNLFNLEKTVSSNGTAGEKGSGIGLILCKEFIEKNKGEIFVESSENTGSKFSFTVPLSAS